MDNYCLMIKFSDGDKMKIYGCEEHGYSRELGLFEVFANGHTIMIPREFVKCIYILDENS